MSPLEKSKFLRSGGHLMPADVINDFFHLAGDANRDRSINIGNFSILASRFEMFKPHGHICFASSLLLPLTADVFAACLGAGLLRRP